jgi:hypothetical protein
MTAEEFCYSYHHLQHPSLLNNLMKPAGSLYYSTLSNNGNGNHSDDSTTTTGTIFKLEDFLNISLDDEYGEEENQENYEESENSTTEFEGSVGNPSPKSDQHSENISEKSPSFRSPALALATSDEHITRHLFQIHQSTQTMPLSSEAVTPLQECQYSPSTSAIQNPPNHMDDEGTDDQIGFCSYVDPFADLVMEQKPDFLELDNGAYDKIGMQLSSPFNTKARYLNQPYHINQVEFTKTLQLRRKKLDHLMLQLTNPSNLTDPRVHKDVSSASLLLQDDDVTMNDKLEDCGDISMDDHDLVTGTACANKYVLINSDGTLKASCNADKWNNRADGTPNQRPLQAY